MSNGIERTGNGRRRFLQTVGLGGAAAGVLAGTGLGLGTASIAVPKGAPAPTVPDAHGGYHLTDHIREYYRKASL